MSAVELVVILLGVSAALQVLARRINVPHPVLLVLGGLGLALIPRLPRIEFAPDALFLLFVPPLLYWAAVTTSLRDFWREFSAIARYATLVVLLTMTVVAIVAHRFIPGFIWPAAFLLGAIVAPPDPVAAIAVLRPLGAARDIVTVLEGEGLVNDATALVAYQIAVAAAVAGTFSPLEAGLRFVVASAGGIAIGLAVGWLIAFVRTHLLGGYPIVENTLSLLTPFLGYLPADWVGASGILSVVTLGLYLGRLGPRVMGAATRVLGEAMWTMLQFLLESLIFIIVGLELPVVVRALRSHTFVQLLIYCLLITLTVVGVRLVYTAITAWLLRWAARRKGRRGPSWPRAAFIGWTGLRGGDSLVIALAIPFTTTAGAPFPARDLIIFITFGVILGTLVAQGLTVVPLLHALKLSGRRDAVGEQAHARRVVAEAGLARLGELADRFGDTRVIHAMQQRYKSRIQRWSVRDRQDHGGGDSEHRALPAGDGGAERRAATYRDLRRETIAAERDAAIRLRDDGTISDSVLRRLQRELDLETMMLDSGEDGAAEPYEEA